MPNFTSYLSHADDFPPALCRLSARTHHGRRLLSHSEIAKRSGISRSVVVKLSVATTWKGVNIETVDSFMKACGVIPFHVKRHAEFLRRGGRKGGLSFLNTAKPLQKQMVNRILRVIAESTERNVNDA